MIIGSEGLQTGQPYSPGDFEKHFFKRFSPKRASRLILDDRQTFHGLKDVVLAGLLAWTLGPDESKMRRSVTVAAVMDKVIKAERWAETRTSRSVSRDFFSRYVRLKQEFIEELYYPVGGLRGAYLNPDSETMSEKLRERHWPVTSTVDIMRILHFVYEWKGNTHKASFERARLVLEEVRDNCPQCLTVRGSRMPYSKDEFGKKWASMSCAGAYVYAAAHTAFSERQSLLEHLLSGSLTPKADAPWVPRWLAKAAYATTIFEGTYDKALQTRAACYAPDCAVERIESAGLHPAEEEIIKRIFLKHREPRAR